MEDYTIGAASHFDIRIFFRLNFVTVVDLCFKKFWQILLSIYGIRKLTLLLINCNSICRSTLYLICSHVTFECVTVCIIVCQIFKIWNTWHYYFVFSFHAHFVTQSTINTTYSAVTVINEWRPTWHNIGHFRGGITYLVTHIPELSIGFQCSYLVWSIAVVFAERVSLTSWVLFQLIPSRGDRHVDR